MRVQRDMICNQMRDPGYTCSSSPPFPLWYYDGNSSESRNLLNTKVFIIRSCNTIYESGQRVFFELVKVETHTFKNSCYLQNEVSIFRDLPIDSIQRLWWEFQPVHEQRSVHASLSGSFRQSVWWSDRKR